MGSKIEWTEETLNCVIGCSPAKGSERGGCAACYAMGQVHRFGERYRNANGLIRLGRSKRDALTFLPTDGDGKTLGKGAKWTGEVWLLPEVLEQPLRRRKPTTYFVNSLADLFHESIVDSEEGRLFVAALFGVMAACPQHRFQILTKRPHKAREWFAWVIEAAWAWERAQLLSAREGGPDAPVLWRFLFQMASQTIGHDRFADLVNRTKRGDWMDRDWAWPLPNAWIGASVENQATADVRVPELLKIPAAVRFLSCEPLLGELDLSRWLMRGMPVTDDLLDAPDGEFVDGLQRVGDQWHRIDEIHWIIAGGESGPKARPMHPDWARSLRDQCVAAGVPYFFKQFGEYSPFLNEAWLGDESKPWHTWVALDGSSGDAALLTDGEVWSNWTGDPPEGPEAGVVVMAKVGKKAAGRELDGRTWDEVPE